jgi:hypothetical protein
MSASKLDVYPSRESAEIGNKRKGFHYPLFVRRWDEKPFVALAEDSG